MIFRGSFGAPKFLTRMLSLILRGIFFEFGKFFFFKKLLRPFVGVNSILKNFRCLRYFKNYQKY